MHEEISSDETLVRDEAEEPVKAKITEVVMRTRPLSRPLSGQHLQQLKRILIRKSRPWLLRHLPITNNH